MSGGRYNYLYQKDPVELIGNSALQAVHDRLASLGYAEDARQAVADIIATIRTYEENASAQIAKISEVLHILEWWDSNDASEDDFQQALEEHRSAAR
ncbi:hypothetical protein [Nocardia altamirensis]|uniref:hypothetical protein n=1 Tax=Nocardia altamirensis TaxID=472158 RepID=UPI000840636F|nr:hypothetical protein [Nocardia altamirensis]